MKKLIFLLLVLPLFFACSSDDENNDDDGDNGVNVLENTVWKQTNPERVFIFEFLEKGFCEYKWYNLSNPTSIETIKYKYSYSSKDKTVTILNYANNRLTIGDVSDNQMAFTLNKVEYNLTKE
jgi:gamma-glutamylcysteine synthetase